MKTYNWHWNYQGGRKSKEDRRKKKRKERLHKIVTLRSGTRRIVTGGHPPNPKLQ